MDTLNLSKLALPKEAIHVIKSQPKLPRHQLGEKFLKGPIPLNWISIATQLPGKSFQVAMALWFLAGMTNSPKVKLTQVVLNIFGVNRHCKYRALEWLSEAGLISVKTSNGKNPIVTIINPAVTDISLE